MAENPFGNSSDPAPEKAPGGDRESVVEKGTPPGEWESSAENPLPAKVLVTLEEVIDRDFKSKGMFIGESARVLDDRVFTMKVISEGQRTKAYTQGTLMHKIIAHPDFQKRHYRGPLGFMQVTFGDPEEEGGALVFSTFYRLEGKGTKDAVGLAADEALKEANEILRGLETQEFPTGKP